MKRTSLPRQPCSRLACCCSSLALLSACRCSSSDPWPPCTPGGACHASPGCDECVGKSAAREACPPGSVLREHACPCMFKSASPMAPCSASVAAAGGGTRDSESRVSCPPASLHWVWLGQGAGSGLHAGCLLQFEHDDRELAAAVVPGRHVTMLPPRRTLRMAIVKLRWARAHERSRPALPSALLPAGSGQAV